MPEHENSARFLRAIWSAAGGDAALGSRVNFAEAGDLPSAFSVSDLAAGAVAAAALAVAELAGSTAVTVDRRLASFWFGFSLRPQGWAPAPPWDPIAGDYAASDGWIRLHTNAPRHRAAALAVLGASGEKDAVTRAVAAWTADDLEGAIVAGGGCAAALRSLAAWAEHPQGKAIAAEPLVLRSEGDGAGRTAASADPSRPLAGVKVLDLTRVLAGPVATRFLAGYGADVLRIDPPDWDEPAITPEVTLGKRCARLDLRDADARQTLLGLLAEADVIVHGYRPGALEHLGLGAAARRAARPGLIDVSLDAYGWTGPWSGRRGFDSLVQMSAGIAEAGMRRAGADRPTPLPVQALDHATGYILATAAVRGLSARRAAGAGSTWRASLARTAALLASAPASGASQPFADRSDADLATGVETTAWGLARRLKPPVAIEGAPMRWDRPAADLGSSPARW
ncbi:MAG TPA: CoA transferase [Caulobacteraceae bacterium]|nr:CoA transferase [Caulobacteraceae bacterium]